ncbi:MAG TPA: glycerol-3-phosphate cytidylyltransferase [Fluviicoccus sp.]|nr:glycerol-3-phosphate cytidylyltransferase [Fluviicoccus sp.]
MTTTVLTYGTFDLFHRGHLRLLERLSGLGDKLVVAVSTDEFNARKGKKALYSYEDRAAIVGAIKHVDLVIPENDWEQKIEDVKKYNVDVFAIGDDWAGKFDFLKAHCDVVYLPRTEGISSTQLRHLLSALDDVHIEKVKEAFDILGEVVKGIR